MLDAAEKHADWKEEWSSRTDHFKEDLETFKDTLAVRQDALQEDLCELKTQLRGRIQQQREELEKMRGRLDEILDGRIFGEARLLKAFPRMRSLKHHKALEKLRQRRNHH